MNKQKGFAHILLLIVLLALIIGALSVVFWKSYTITNSSIAEPSTSTDESSSTPKEVTYKEHTSITGSGLSFAYPDSWTLLPPDGVAVFGNGDKMASSLLLSQELSKNSDRPQVPSDHICVTLTEYSGVWPRIYRNGKSDSAATDSEFTVGAIKVGLITHEDKSKGYFMGSLVSIDPFERGFDFIALKNNYFLRATSESNCYHSENPKQRDVSVDIEQAKDILKSVRLAD